MQINLSTNLPNSAAETAAKSPDQASAGQASDFFAQMGQLWIPGEENHDSDPAEKPVVQNQSAICSDPMSALLGAALLIPNAINSGVVTDPDSSDPNSTAYQGINGSSAILNAGNPAEVVSESIPSRAEKDSKGRTDVFQGLDFSQPFLNESYYPLTLSAQTPANGEQGIGIINETAAIMQAMVDPETVAGSAQGIESVYLQKFIAGKTQQTEQELSENANAEIKQSAGNPYPEEAAAEIKKSTAQPYPEEMIAGKEHSLEKILTNSQTGISEAITGFKGNFRDMRSKGDRLQNTVSNQNDLQAPDIKIPFPASIKEIKDSTDQSKFRSFQMKAQEDAVLQPSGSDAFMAVKEMARIESGWQKILQGKLDAIKIDLPASQTTPANPPQELMARSAANTPGGNQGAAVEQASVSQNSRAQDKVSQSALPGKFENIVLDASESSKPGGSSANQDQAQNPTFTRSVAQNKSENGQTAALGKFQTSIAERSQEIQPAMASSPSRYAEASNPGGAATISDSSSRPRELVFQLADHIQVQLREGKEVIRIQLKPDTLGRIEIRAETTLNGVTARITTDSSNVKTYLENNLQLLQQTLSDQGLRVDRIQVVVQDAYDSQSSAGHNAQFGHAGSGRNGRDSDSQSETSASVLGDPSDEITVDPLSWLALNPNNRFYTIA